MFRRPWALVAALAAACAFGASSEAAAPAACGWSGYSYAGMMGLQGRYGVAADLTPTARPSVASGHIAAWVGVGGAGLGPNGSDEWLQVGLAAFPGRGLELYYELARPGVTPKYVRLAANVPVGRSYRVAVLESRTKPGFWRVWVNGRRRTQRIFLPGSHGSWNPVATAESWDGGERVCNGYGFRFNQLSVAGTPGGAWRAPRSHQVIQDPGYRVLLRSRSSFLARRAAG